MKKIGTLLILFFALALQALAQESGIPADSSIRDGQCASRLSGVTVGADCGGEPSNINRLLSGGGYAYSGSGLAFVVSSANYVIAGQNYSSAITTVTLNAADGSNPRFDALVVDDSGTATKVSGAAAAAPAFPAIDPATQLLLGYVSVPAAATTPGGVVSQNVYLENTEWTCTTSDASNDCNSTSNPYAGSKDIEGTTVARNDYVRLTTSVAVPVTSSGNLTLFIRSKAAWANNRSLMLAFQLATAQVGNGVTLANGSFGFNSGTTGAYQLVVIPLSQFGALTTVDRLQITASGSGGSQTIGYYLDNIILQTGVAPAQSITGVSPIVVTGSQISCPTCDTGANLTTKGGLIGGLITGASTGSSGPWGSAVSVRYPINSNYTLRRYSYCLTGANAAPAIATRRFVRKDTGDAEIAIGTDVHRVTFGPGAAAGCTTDTTYLYRVAAYDFLQSVGDILGTAGSSSAWTAEVVEPFQPIGATYGGGAAPAASSTFYSGPAQGATLAATDEGTVVIPMPAGTLSNCLLTTSTAQSATGTQVWTIRKDRADATAIQITLGTSVAAGIYPDTDSVTFTAGQTLSWSIVTGTGTQATVRSFSCKFVFAATGVTGVFILPRRASAFSASVTRYVPFHSIDTPNTTALNFAVPITRPATLQNFRCFLDTAPANNAVITLHKGNLSASANTAITITFTSGSTPDTVISDSTHQVAVVVGDWIVVEAVTLASTQAVISCSLEEVS